MVALELENDVEFEYPGGHMRVRKHWHLARVSLKRAATCLPVWAALACGGGQEPETPEPVTHLGEPSDDVDPELIGAAVRSNARHFQLCYETGRARNPELAGRVDVRFLINTDGSVGGAMIVDTDLPSQMARCVIQAFYGLRLPRQEAAVIAQYPMFFQPS